MSVCKVLVYTKNSLKLYAYLAKLRPICDASVIDNKEHTKILIAYKKYDIVILDISHYDETLITDIKASTNKNTYLIVVTTRPVSVEDKYKKIGVDMLLQSPCNYVCIEKKIDEIKNYGGD